jgi:hypothetical protein
MKKKIYLATRVLKVRVSLLLLFVAGILLALPLPQHRDAPAHATGSE